MRWLHHSGLLLLASILAVLPIASGCGSSDGLVGLGGTVTFDGTPISEGRIQFRSTTGDLKAYSARIENGKYEIRVEPGEAAVQIYASRPVPGKFEEVNPGEKDQVGEMYIPERYNSRTELSVNVEGPKEDQDFALTP